MMIKEKINVLKEKTVFFIKAYPNAKENKIVLSDKIEEKELFKVYITKNPEKNLANKEIIKLFAKKLKIPKSNVIIAKGLTSRVKLLELKNIKEKDFNLWVKLLMEKNMQKKSKNS